MASQGEGVMGDAKSAVEASLKELVEEKPYVSITVSDICENAHVSRKSFYNIFENKDDVLSSIFKQDVTEPLESLNAVLTQEQAYGMSMLFYEKVYERIYDSASFYINLIRPMKGRDDTFIRIATHAIYDLNISILTSHEWMEDRMKAEYVAYFFASSQAMLMQKWVSDGMPYTPHELATLYEEMTRQFWMVTFPGPS